VVVAVAPGRASAGNDLGRTNMACCAAASGLGWPPIMGTGDGE